MTHQERQNGIALVAVLWVLLLLSVLAASLLKTVREEAHATAGFADRAKAEALADAGLYKAIAMLLDARSTGHWRLDGTLYAVPFGGVSLHVSVQDERGKIDLNTASDPLLNGLFLSAGLSQSDAATMVDRIVDWRSPGELHRLNGAKAPEYLAAGYGYGPRNAPFHSISELRLVMGMTTALFRKVEPALTIYSGASDVDTLVAPPEVLAALPGMTSDAVAATIKQRQVGTDAGSLEGVVGMIDTSRAGHAFCVISEAVLNEGVRFTRRTIVRMTGNDRSPYWIHQWEDEGSMAAGS